ncbi:MAG: hypothetical protein OHK0040_00060 [bacterium]
MILKFRAGYEVGFPKEEFDNEKTEASYKKYRELVSNEEVQARRRKELEDKEKAKKDDFVSTFLFEKRGMQLLFTEEDAMLLISFGEKNLDRFDEVISAYTFFNDYIPSVVYTKRLRLILYGMDKGRGKRTLSTTEVQNIINDPNLLILIGLTGNEPDELEGSEIYLEQEGVKVMPYNFKVPSKGERTSYWPKSPSYFWRILVNFPYESLNLNKNAKLIVKKNSFYREFTLNFPSYR